MKTVRALLAKEVVPQFPGWEAAGAVPRDFYRRLGELGVLDRHKRGVHVR